ncbi:transmembrane protein, putative [Bodo saltans]|uniref:Transmembrane protein, putative n=1 Tax=Bodo saltans TaxID=75058 RepID=A0A0S4J2M6_BODSA|nr:transmembrane protein, putative [Bodo saltans]|eukprot:CUG62018.1 transmembrane protein, putative [Bodo saltans]
MIIQKTDVMGPRAAGFFVGSTIAAGACGLLLQFDLMRRLEARTRHIQTIEETYAHLLKA